MAHIDTVAGIYQAFGRGNIPAILEQVADDVEWEYGVNSTDVPWLQSRRGRAAVQTFFESLAALEIHAFAPTRLMIDGDLVVGIVNLEATVRTTGRRISEVDEVHLWHFDADGKVVRFRHRADTHQHWAAYGDR